MSLCLYGGGVASTHHVCGRGLIKIDNVLWLWSAIGRTWFQNLPWQGNYNFQEKKQRREPIIYHAHSIVEMQDIQPELPSPLQDPPPIYHHRTHKLRPLHHPTVTPILLRELLRKTTITCSINFVNIYQRWKFMCWYWPQWHLWIQGWFFKCCVMKPYKIYCFSDFFLDLLLAYLNCFICA